MRNEILILPDIHGRDFWVKPTAFDRFRHIVFLGDYLDPYWHESITAEMALSNFNEIIKLKKQFPNLVTLLIGNHDAHYWWQQGEGPRYILDYDELIHATFQHNRDLFQLVYTQEIGGKKFIFSHAGIMKEWMHDNGIDDMPVEELNALLDKPNIGILEQVSEYRGGYDPYPSPIWADMWDFNGSEPIPDTYQIFGHSQRDEPSIMKDWACLDCRKPFVLNIETGEIKEWVKE